MPSSLIFAGLAVAWLVVLVPMVAQRRQEVVHTAESALAARVLPRPGPGRGPGAAPRRTEEVADMGERGATQELRGERAYRPGRGGYDAEAAALAARARYAFRRRVVAGLVLAAAVSLVLALVAAPVWWSVLALAVAGLVGYLGYLRRQVRIEEEVRRRRAARSAGSRRPRSSPAPVEPLDDVDGSEDDAEHTEVLERVAPAAVDRGPAFATPPGAQVLDLDDEDPAFEELDPAFEPPYRRAVGE